ncbi:MAG: trehalose-6-phosphate synthase [Rhodothermales bacterium]
MRLIIVANRAPIRKLNDGWTPSIGGLATALLPVLMDQGGVWVSMKDDDQMPPRLEYARDGRHFTVRRVDLTPREFQNYYCGMANRVLWPISHYMIHHVELQTEFMSDYKLINSRFAEAVAEEYQEGDYVWVQDYHLMMAPQMIRARLPHAMIAHFWHIPWPAMEVYRILPWARELLHGMLGCDVIGFHVEEYVENFLESVRVLLGARAFGNTIHWEGRQIRVEAHPIGIDVSRFERMSEDVEREAYSLREEVGAEHLVVGIDRLDYTKGILSRLLAFEQFLKDYPEYHRRVAFYQVATPSRTEVESYQQLKREVDEAVGRINGAFSVGSWVPVHYRYRSYTQQELCVFYRAADVGLITPLRDGMNLVTQEFIAANERGILVLSELTGAAYLLPEALQVNPYDHFSLTRIIKEAIEISAEERKVRLARLKERVTALDVHRWADGFLTAFTAA